jgi:hypothetical protein
MFKMAVVPHVNSGMHPQENGPHPTGRNQKSNDKFYSLQKNLFCYCFFSGWVRVMQRSREPPSHPRQQRMERTPEPPRRRARLHQQRAPQSERLPQPQRRSPEWNEAGAERFAGPFVTMRRSRTQDTARVEQLRGRTEKPPPNLLDPDESIFEIFAEVCRRRWPSGRRPQAPQRPHGFSEGASS